MDIATLLDLLRGYVPSDPNEVRDVAAVIDLLERDGAAGLHRSHFSPGHLTASGFVRNGDGVLLIHHDRLGRWMQPGGHIELEDHSIEVAALREIEEETGIAGVVSLGLLDVDVHRIPAGKGEPSHLHLDLRWAFEGVGEPSAGDGVSAALWVPIAELPDWDVDDSVLRASRKLFEGRTA